MTDTSSITEKCGGCGCVITQNNRRSDYNSLCSSCPVPHQDLLAFPIKSGGFKTTSSGDKLWECQYCLRSGSMEEIEAVDCSHAYVPCSECREHPYCAPDCVGIAAALTGDGVYLAGFQPA